MFARRFLTFATLLSLATGLFVSPAFAATGELSLYESNINFSSNFFLEGRSTRIWASPKNESNQDLLGSVNFKTNREGQIGSSQPISALAGNTDDVFVDFTPSGYGEYVLTITVIPWEPAGDSAANNTVTKTIFVEQNTDYDALPNNTDPDDDNDGIPDEEDEFPLTAEEWEDTDGDGTGNNADTDDDNDGILDEDDDFPLDPLFSADQDGDGIPDEDDDDVDGDGLNTQEEKVAGTNPKLEDTDEDGAIDGQDPFPTDGKEWSDLDGDGIGDNSDDDADGDGLLNKDDASPYDPAPQAKTKASYLTDLNKEVVFDASDSLDNKGIIKYLWTFGEETFDGPSISKSFDATGLQAATLTVFDESGQSDTIDIKVRILDLQFLFWAGLFALLLILLAFALIYRYNRRALKQVSKSEPQKETKKKPSKKKKKS